MYAITTNSNPRELVIGVVCLFFAFSSSLLADEIDFERDVLPIFNENCLDCHGPDEQESGFRVDSRVALLKGGDYGEPAIVPGDAAKGMLLKAISYEDSNLEMPPDDRLSDEKIAILHRWVEAGANWPGQMEDEVVREKSGHWAFQRIVRPSVPSHIVSDCQPSRENSIDAFLSDRLAKDNLKFSPRADARTLMKRAAVVLAGLPPTPAEFAAFEKAYSLDSETAYAELVDRLLDSPHFGERWAQHWLDVIRWAETNGSESNMYRKNAWVYRDYVIRAFNDDKPYDRFLFEQMAGDTIGQGNATGYLVSGSHVPASTVGAELSAQRQARADRMDEILQTIGASALGVTIGCARCHNHKFDPISIGDYYSMSAVFQDIEFGSRFPELAEDDPLHMREIELRKALRKIENELSEYGPWEEDWDGYRELFMPAIKTQKVRFKFSKSHVRLDEIEIFGPENRKRNLALSTEGTQAFTPAEVEHPNGGAEKINDGLRGVKGWISKSPPGSKIKPSVELTFAEPFEIDRIKLSTNLEDFYETDYLNESYLADFGGYQLEAQDAEGNWIEVVTTMKLQKLNKQNSNRAGLVANLNKLIRQLNNDGPQPAFVARFVEPGKTHIFSRGSPENPGDEVFAAGLTELEGNLGLEPDASGKQRRTAFAEWVISPENPLTARVAANRLWHHVFGQGIVTTTSDFGEAGAPPTHPELLDWLAAELKSGGGVEPQQVCKDESKQMPAKNVGANHTPSKPWSMKHLIRLMVMSDAFRQSSSPQVDSLAVDSGSALLWRFPPRRMEAEVIRDSILQASGVLDPAIGGRSFRIHNVKQRYAQWQVEDNHGPETWRRMIYQERMRRVDDQMFTAFDFPDCGQVRAKRPVSTTPLQALNLLNSPFVMEQSTMIAARAKKDSGGEIKLAIGRCFELLLTRQPAPDELEACLELAQQTDLSLVCRTLMNTNEFAFLP